MKISFLWQNRKLNLVKTETYWRGNARVNAKEEDGEYVRVDGVVGAVLVLDKIFRISSIDSNTIEKLLLGLSIQKKFGRHSSKEKFILNQIFRKIPPGIIISGDDKKRIIRNGFSSLVLMKCNWGMNKEETICQRDPNRL
ncbi:hypothetical protein V1477_017867 [Vespula maculifrons]|uniref:Uncharacterized protein n=1 Tax=Vespula maculifrons TaxID=7453 RepID=A0ABD2AZK6_VESMC